MKKLFFLIAILSIPASLFSQADTAKKVKSSTSFGEAADISIDAIQKLPVNDNLIGKWVLISSKIKNGHEEDMAPWDMQTLEFKNDRTLIIAPGPYERKIYWSYMENEKKLVIYSMGEGSKVITMVKFPILKMKDDIFTTTEWVNIKPKGEYYQKLTFLKVE
jgi:hypothetical protein